MDGFKTFLTNLKNNIKNEIEFKIKYDKATLVKYGVIFIAIIAVSISLTVANMQKNTKSNEDGALSTLNTESESLTVSESAVTSEIYIDVSGAVINPGVVKLADGSRVFQAVELAGGLKKDADMMNVNLAATLNDGDKIYIPSVSEQETQALSGIVTETISNNKTNAGAMQNVHGSKININMASAEELQSLSGIGPATAQRIIDYRNQYGSFHAVTDLLNISGIGEKTLEKFKDKICV